MRGVSCTIVPATFVSNGRPSAMASPLDNWLRSARIRTRHEVEVAASPSQALATLLGAPIAPDRLVATLFALRRLHRTGPIGQALQASGFLLLEHSSQVHVV